MKKIFFLLFTLFCFVGIANAQWLDPVYNEGDELTERSSYWGYTYVDRDGVVSFVDYLNNHEDPNVIFFYTSKSIFDYDYDFSFDYQCASCIIGFYSDNKLIEKITIEVWVFSDTGDSAVLSARYNSNNVSIIEKIIKHLTTVGDVRFVIPRYSEGNFDITVTKNSKLFKNIAK